MEIIGADGRELREGEQVALFWLRDESNDGSQIGVHIYVMRHKLAFG